jgi:DNA-binding beta-propeller fold protein YncE
VFHTDLAGHVLGGLPNARVSGIAFNGSFLYFSDMGGNITRRTADGGTVLASFAVAPVGTPSEDLAWDPARQRLWRIEHDPATVRRIHPTTGAVEATYSIPALDPDPDLTPRGGVGIAYDCHRDRLYVSFFQANNLSNKGLVLVMDPNTGTITGELFRAQGPTGGLAYDGESDALWVGSAIGSVETVRNMSLSGSVVSSFERPQPGGFVDGLEFVGGCDATPARSCGWGQLKVLYR